MQVGKSRPRDLYVLALIPIVRPRGAGQNVVLDLHLHLHLRVYSYILLSYVALTCTVRADLSTSTHVYLLRPKGPGYVVVACTAGTVMSAPKSSHLYLLAFTSSYSYLLILILAYI